MVWDTTDLRFGFPTGNWETTSHVREKKNGPVFRVLVVGFFMKGMHTSKISSFLVASISAAIQNLLDLRPEWHSIMVGDRIHEFQRMSGTSLTMSEVIKNDIVLLVFFSTFSTFDALIYSKNLKIPNMSTVSKLKRACFLQHKVVSHLRPMTFVALKTNFFDKYVSKNA